MINKQNNFADGDGADVSGLLATLNRVEAPGDFNFRVKARIAQGRPARARSSWATLALRLSLPAVVMATAGGYLGYRTLFSDNFSITAVNDVQPAPSVTTNQSQPTAEVSVARTGSQMESPSVTKPEIVAAVPEPTSRVARTGQKGAVTPKTESERSGGSYVEALGESKTVRQPDIDDNDTKPVRQVIVSAAQFLSSSGVVSSSAGAGGKIEFVSGAAAQAGLRAGDVIESVSVKTGTIRVTRDGKSLIFSIR